MRVPGFGIGDVVGFYWDDPIHNAHLNGEAVQAGVGTQVGVPQGNYYSAPVIPAINKLWESRRTLHDQQYISLNPDMIPVGGAFVFWKRFDDLALVAETYDLTQFKPWEAHQDSISLVEETYTLTVISGYPSTSPRFVSQVVYVSGILIEWEPPADEGSAPISEYRLYRGPDLGSMTLIATLDGDTRHYFDTGAPDGSVYKLLAFNGVLESDPAVATAIIDPDQANISLRDAVTGDMVAGLFYAGWMGVRLIELDPSITVMIKQGATLSIMPTVHPADATVPTLAWSSSRDDLVSVSSGEITAISPGRAVITASSTDGTHKSASVAVVVVPAFMVDDLKVYLDAQALGVPVFARKLPDGIDSCLGLVQLAGEAADPSGDVANPSLQVLIRSTSFAAAEELRKVVHDLLHGLGPVTINGTRYALLEAFSIGAYTEKERKVPRYVSTISFRVSREFTISETADAERSHDITGRSP